MTDDLERLKARIIYAGLDAADAMNEALARIEALQADNARLREVVLEADKLLCGDLAGLQWKRECRSFLVLARAVLKGETRD